jgi:putative DNA primase/helicase
VAQVPDDSLGALEASDGGVMRAEAIHAQTDWPAVLAQLGVPESALQNRHGPCPICGGTDRFRFDNREGRGTWICNQCGAGDGFQLLERLYRWPFAEARRRVIEATGIDRGPRVLRVPVPPREPPRAGPTDRVLRLRRDQCRVADCPDAVAYLQARGLWPLPPRTTLRAHATLEYFDQGERKGRHPALIAEIRDVAGELVSVHVTYLQGGQKLDAPAPRKILSALTPGRIGCAVRLMPAGQALGIAEGIETALSAAVLEQVPVWAALNAGMLARFEPPPGVTLLRIYPDRDEAGLTAALRLAEQLQCRVRFEVRLPRGPAKDWNDALLQRGAA